jgi:hypothetical protein
MSRLPVLFDLYYFDLFYFAGGYRRVSRLSSAQCNLRSRRVHLCFDAFSDRETDAPHQVRRKNMTERDRESGNQLFVQGRASEQCCCG